MRIGILARYLYNKVGGIEVFARGLKKTLQESGHSVTMFSSGKETDEGFAYKHITILNEPIFFPSDLFKVDLDILHLQYPSPMCFFWSVLFRLIKRKPVVVTYHSNPASSFLVRVLGKLFDIFVFYPMTLLFGINVVYTYNGLKPGFLPGTAIRNGIRSFFFKNKQEKDIDILYAGRFVRHKHPEMIISAVKESKANLNITFVGEGPLEGELKKSAEEASLNEKFLGRVSENELADLLSRSRIFILPSEMEGDPIIVGEALASGCMVFATPVGSIPETIPKEWIIRNKGELVEKLGNISELQMFKKEARMPYDEQTCFKRYLQVFEGLVK